MTTSDFFSDREVDMWIELSKREPPGPDPARRFRNGRHSRAVSLRRRRLSYLLHGRHLVQLQSTAAVRRPSHR